MRRLTVAAMASLAVLSGSCQDGYFGSVRAGRRLSVELVEPSDPGSRTEPLAISVQVPRTFRIKVRALTETGATDTAFNGYVRLSSKPGAIEPIDGVEAEGRNLLLVDGESLEVDVRVANAYGTTHILADDLGYIPVDPLRDPPPACADGLDNDGDGLIDFPADPGCAFANDDAEQGSSYAQGASPPLFFGLPRVADVRGLTCLPEVGCSGTGFTPYQREQIQIDTGFRETPEGDTRYAFDLIVTRISSNGFYVTDTKDVRGGFRSIFAFNFNAPPRMRVCDRLRSLNGTATEFFGFTQVSYPTWTLEEWDPQERPCLVPEPTVLSPGVMSVSSDLLRITGDLVRVETLPDRSLVARVTSKFGPGNMPRGQGGAFVPGEDATNCDFNEDGRIEFAPGNPEGECATACSSDVDCTEWSNYIARNNFRITVLSPNGGAAIQADATASNEFDPYESKGTELRAFSGTLHYFSGGAQYTIQARCKDDIVVDLAAPPLPSDRACVVPRTVLENNPQ
jgi:hypothetical protein